MTWAASCHYCDRKVYPSTSPEVMANSHCMRTHDHVDPEPSGRRSQSKIVTACHGCNNLRGDTPYEIFLFFRKTYKSTSVLADRTFYRKFCFDLMRTGFIAAKSLIKFRQREEAKGVAPQMNRRRRAEAAEVSETVVSAPPREAKPYTLKDLRSPRKKFSIDAATVKEAEKLLSNERQRDKAVIEEAQRAIAILDAEKAEATIQ